MKTAPKKFGDDSLTPTELRKQRSTLVVCIVLIIVAVLLIVNELVKR